MAILFLSAQNPRPIYEISITSGFYLTVSFTSEDKYSNPAYFDRKHKSGLYFLHSFNQLNQIILITVFLFWTKVSVPNTHPIYEI
jgi:hypothetical protein